MEILAKKGGCLAYMQDTVTKIVTFNVNGIRAREAAKLSSKLQELNADFICLQEVRADDTQIPYSFKQAFPNYFLSISNIRKGYAGVMTISKEPVTSEELTYANQTGRAIRTKLDKFDLINVYVPNSGQSLERLDVRVQWMQEFVNSIYPTEKPTIVVGDFNVLPTDKDTNRKNVKVGRTKQEREVYELLISNRNVDIWRSLHPDILDYTWYSAQHNGREAHRGDRNDLCIVDGRLFENIVSCEILHNYHCGSDHTPILLEVLND